MLFLLKLSDLYGVPNGSTLTRHSGNWSGSGASRPIDYGALPQGLFQFLVVHIADTSLIRYLLQNTGISGATRQIAIP